MNNSYPSNDFIGASPAQVKWRVVRGDTSSLSIQFYENDEITYSDTSTWTYSSTAYDKNTETSHFLNTQAFSGYVTITATPETTASWGVGNKFSELSFDLQVTIGNDVVWTPIIGIISVLNDVTVS